LFLFPGDPCLLAFGDPGLPRPVAPAFECPVDLELGSPLLGPRQRAVFGGPQAGELGELVIVAPAAAFVPDRRDPRAHVGLPVELLGLAGALIGVVDDACVPEILLAATDGRARGRQLVLAGPDPGFDVVSAHEE
jgi:hypothetical protein